MHKRFIDRPNAKQIVSSTEGFKLRTYGSYVVWVCLSLIILAAAAKFIISDTATNMFDDNNTLTVADILVSIIIMAIAAMVFGAYLIYNLMKLKDVINMTEFQAALFASSMRTHTLLCCIVDSNKNVIYADSDAMRLFKNKDNDVEKLRDILAYDGLSDGNKAKIDLAVVNAKKEEVSINYKNIKGESVDAILVVDPIERPKGFSVIRCYDLKEKVV
ncbi:MAG: hypothetical protein PQ612_07815 [Rickettsiales bacterium]|nr:hypothetical protein [Pseudomonadota bacterium]MDA0966994.1 hypothetical protein [Pseudomonadota bacterium]MDG4543914.1 hypothetical protein [Rickettsiales bacterium]MDG4546060.1 hypothetical protein [Rickettsiales bacterium]MDG4548306.1 hypothetical protein [Rickettsiales bacterium]